MSTEIKPILVIGMNRSGTKWLSNILCNHPQIIGLQRERQLSGGIMETNMFYNIPRLFGDLRLADNYVAFIEFWAQTDFFKVAQTNKEMFYTMNPRPTDHLALFKMLMDDLASRHESKYWLQKTSPNYALEVTDYFSNASVIVIQRDIVDNLRSNIQNQRKRGARFSLLKRVFLYVAQEKVNKITQKKCGAYSINYESLKADTPKQVRAICDWLEIDFHPEMVNIQFNKNTSFSNESERKDILSKRDEIIIRLWYRLLKPVPFFIVNSIRNYFRSREPQLIAGTFGTIRDKYNIH